MSDPIVVVGGGLAAGTFVTELRELGHDGPVTVISNEPHPPYERPPLTKSFLRGETPAEETYVQQAEWYADHGVTLVTGSQVRGVDLGDHSLATDSGRISFGKLVLATGCRARRLPLTSSEIGVHHLRSLADSTALKDVLSPGVRLLVVGGGWIGLEVAASARTVGAGVTLVEPTAQPLSGTLGVEVGEWFAELHRSHGVELRLGSGLETLDGPRAVLDDGSRLEVDHVLVGIGAVPNTELAEAAGLDVDNGILVDASLVTSHPDVLAIGDVASHLHPVLGERIRVEHWQNAQSQGKHAARVVAGDAAQYDELPSFFSDQYDAGLEFFGHVGRKPADVTVNRTDDGLLAWWHRGKQLVAAAHVNAWDDSEELKREVAAGWDA